MKFQKKPSGLVIPVQPPEPEKPKKPDWPELCKHCSRLSSEGECVGEGLNHLVAKGDPVDIQCPDFLERESMKFQKRSSGLVIPAVLEEPKEPEKPRLPLELDDGDVRDAVEKAFHEIIRDIDHRSLFMEDKTKNEARDALVTAVAKQLLGLDWDIERLC